MVELWIRSQDKEVLTRVVDIWKDADKNEIWSKSSFATKNCLGIYKTKERALEVLDEIQDIVDFIVCSEAIKYSADDYMQFDNERLKEIQKNGLVYEMPKE